MGTVNSDHQNGASEFAFGQQVDLTMNFIFAGADIQYAQILCYFIGNIMGMVVADIHACTSFEGFNSLIIRGIGCQPRLYFLNIGLYFATRKAKCLVKRVEAIAAGFAIKIRAIEDNRAGHENDLASHLFGFGFYIFMTVRALTIFLVKKVSILLFNESLGSLTHDIETSFKQCFGNVTKGVHLYISLNLLEPIGRE